MVYAVSGTMSTEGSDPSFDRLFLREYARVAGIAYRVVGDADEAEDIAQEVFCSFYGRHAPDAPYAAPWLYRAASHAALNALRGKRRRTQRETLAEAEGYRTQTREESDPARVAENAEGREELRRALAGLPEKSASVLILRYSGLSYAEVAAALGVSTGQIGTLLRRAEAALRKEMTHATPR
jgi:RNA polymerase sigma-70 factor (ECF subfamily)